MMETHGNHTDSHGMILAWHVIINAIYSAFVYVDKWGCLKLIKSTPPIAITINK